ncbi:hypothetical protein CTAYLR_000405 [Chrysophaeum taylorii]|uniref:Uncharacterized protein n=1 Tax=Chrysophaeum taylorii TaxID=2483200 RepID=A0AAD7UG37_9STRA|nr:hypothetical protein CTAYLR_000405 [Chrysophaeum taylorii]
MFPFIPVVVASGSSLLAGLGGWAVYKYEQLAAEMSRISAQAAQLQQSADSAKQGSVWSELLEPIARRWSGALKTMAFAVAAASFALIVVGLGTWLEIRCLRCESDRVRRLEDEIDRLKRENDSLSRRDTSSRAD